ncbi:MAG: hypothetical protein HWE24_06605 [Oceanospirillaceae bacterium]|nr:hypothetical protein [Oceanospirillaceae bacterium]
MKRLNIIYLLIVVYIVCFGCNEINTSKDKTDGKLKNDSLTVEVKPELKGDFTIYEHDLSMYNEKYLMRITPTINSNYNQYESNILLTKKGDTIFNKRINIDSLGQTILKYEIFADSTEHSKIGTDYELRRVVYHGVRTNDLYFVAEIASIEGKKDLNVLFQLSYLGKNEIGKLFVNGFSKKGWGNNAGEIDNERNRKITAP